MYHVKKTCAIICTALLICLGRCQKDNTEIPKKADQPSGLDGFTKYAISKVQHYANNNSAVAISVSEWRFQVYFDSSAIYTVPGADQFDINKLSGFADNKSLHTQYSARFGWRWSEGRLRLFGFVHNAGVIKGKEISSIDIGKIYTCSIKVVEGQYVFTIEDFKNSVVLPRAAATPAAEGYRLYPYFGGNQVAPHEIHIWLKYL